MQVPGTTIAVWHPRPDHRSAGRAVVRQVTITSLMLLAQVNMPLVTWWHFNNNHLFRLPLPTTRANQVIMWRSIQSVAQP